MQKNRITKEITPCCGLPFSVMYWWIQNITLSSETDRTFIFEQLKTNGSLSVVGWKVLINSGALEEDSVLNKSEFLDFFNCREKPSCEILKLIVDNFKVGSYNPNDDLGIGWTELTTFENYDGKVIQKIIGYDGGVGDLPTQLSGRIGKYFADNDLTTNKDNATYFKIQILNGSISPQKTTFAKEILIFKKNRFNKTTLLAGHYINENNGNEDANASYNATPLIRVDDLQGDFITATYLLHGAFYDIDGIYISGFLSAPFLEVPITAHFIRTSFYVGDENTFQVEQGKNPTLFEDFENPTNGIIIKDLQIVEKTPENRLFFANPSLIYVVENRQIDFIFESFIIPKIGFKLSDYYTSAFGYRGVFYQNKARLIPTDDSDLLFKSEKYPDIEEKKRINIKTAKISNGSGQNRKILVIGDSTVNSGFLIKEINDYFSTDPMNVDFIGTRDTGGIMHEGRSGWTYNWYFTQASNSGVANPFFDGTTFNFSNYLSTTSQTMSAGDWVFIQLGINDLYSIAGSFFGGDVDGRILQMEAQLTEMIAQIHAVNSNIRVGVVMTIPPAISQDATGNLLQSAFYSVEYYLKKGLVKWWGKLLSLFDNDFSRDSKIYLIPCNMILDRVNNFQTQEQDIDAFNTDKKTIQIDDVHPKVSGYKQKATAYIGAIKYFG